jgi:hypothetical protein
MKHLRRSAILRFIGDLGCVLPSARFDQSFRADKPDIAVVKACPWRSGEGVKRVQRSSKALKGSCSIVMTHCGYSTVAMEKISLPLVVRVTLSGRVFPAPVLNKYSLPFSSPSLGGPHPLL